MKTRKKINYNQDQILANKICAELMKGNKNYHFSKFIDDFYPYFDRYLEDIRGGIDRGRGCGP